MKRTNINYTSYRFDEARRNRKNGGTFDNVSFRDVSCQVSVAHVLPPGIVVPA